MTRRLHHTILILSLSLLSLPSLANVYVIIYATRGGRTGHAGVAVDNYQVQDGINTTDTVSDGTLTYYDLWPADDDFGLFSLSKDREARYYKLPNAIWPAPLTIASLYDAGIPHREHYAPDALLMFRTTLKNDYLLKNFLDSAIRTPHPFNPRHFNCSDFVILALRQVTGKHIRAKEFMPFAFTTTPNKLCRRLMRLRDTVVIKSPGNKVKGAFLWERVFAKKPPPLFLVSN
jgi:hypothetical protein